MRKKSVIRYLITVNPLLLTCSEPVIKPFRTQSTIFNYRYWNDWLSKSYEWQENYNVKVFSGFI